MPAPPKRRRYTWRSKALRSIVYQVVALVLLAAAGAYLLHNTLGNMRARGIQSGFDFVTEPAGFSIGESIIPFDSAESYGKAYLVALTNTVRVAIVGIVLATLLGTLIGIGRLSRNFLVRTLCGAYVEIFRNVPLLLQLFIWYFILTEMLPPVEEAWRIAPGLWFSKNGLQFPIPQWDHNLVAMALGALAGAVLAWGWARICRRRRDETGSAPPVVLPGIAMVIGGIVAGWALAGAGAVFDVPEKTEINVIGGGAVTPEFLTVLFGLTIYTASYIAEIVRTGIQAVPYGQHEASAALGLTRAMEIRLVQLPQALRVIVPPLTSQYLNLTKNSSLAVAVGYPDLVSIAATALNQTGRAVECITLVMACYLTLSLVTAGLMNLYNRRVAIRER